MARCNDCEKKLGFDGTDGFGVVLEWLSKDSAVDKIKETKCPVCGSDDWYFTDDMGQ